jgi:light-regulated signal transduction histidine kinase (bacteriophytochrome)
LDGSGAGPVPGSAARVGDSPLLENAVRHGGRPDLVVVVDGRAGPAGTVELSVRDNGKGIPTEHGERVFGVFERLEGRPAAPAPAWPGHLPQDP